MTPLDKALADIDASSRTNEDSSSIVHGRWVGIGVARDIVKTLAEEMDKEEDLTIAYTAGLERGKRLK